VVAPGAVGPPGGSRRAGRLDSREPRPAATGRATAGGSCSFTLREARTGRPGTFVAISRGPWLASRRHAVGPRGRRGPPPGGDGRAGTARGTRRLGRGRVGPLGSRPRRLRPEPRSSPGGGVPAVPMASPPDAIVVGFDAREGRRRFATTWSPARGSQFLLSLAIDNPLSTRHLGVAVHLRPGRLASRVPAGRDVGSSHAPDWTGAGAGDVG